MDTSLPSYEAAMREARAYLRRRDLSSQDEVPLYFAWQRLYATANANLSTDFLQETRSELRARQEARLAPRRGVSPPLFTSFDKVNRSSAQASAFLRSGTSSAAAIEMMARRYRREAEKLRSSRDNLVKSLDEAETRVKKAKRRLKSPVQEVEELLGGLEHAEVPSDTDDPLLGKNVKSKVVTGSLGGGGKRVKKSIRRQVTPDHDPLGAYEDAHVLLKSNARGSVAKGKRGVGSSKDGFEDELGVGVNRGKAAELRRSSLSKSNPAAGPSFSTVANVAAFAARVSDWRMPPDIDRASSAPELAQKGAASKASASGKRLSGASELSECAPVEGEAGDMTLDSSVGSSGLEEDSFDPDASLGVDGASVSPMGRRSTKRESAVKAVETKANTTIRGQEAGNVDAKAEMVRDPSRIFSDTDSSSIEAHQTLPDNSKNAARKSEFHQKLIQLSHAVGDMQVKIQGKQIKVTFKGELDGATDVGSSEPFGGDLELSNRADDTKQPSAVQKVFDTAGHTYIERNDAAEQRDNTNDWEQTRHQAQGRNVPHNPNTVRFADTTAPSDSNDKHNESRHASDQQSSQNELGQQQLRDASAVIPSAKYEGQPRQIQSSSLRESSSTRAVGTVAQQEVDRGEIQEAEPPSERGRSSKLQERSVEGGNSHERSDEERFDEDDAGTQADALIDRAELLHDATPTSEDEGSMREYEENRRSSSREQQDLGAGCKSDTIHKEPSQSQPNNSEASRERRHSSKQQQQLKDDERSDKKDFDEGDFRTCASDRGGLRGATQEGESISERQENRDSLAEGPQHEQSVPNAKVALQDARADRKSDVRREASHHRAHSSGRGQLQALDDGAIGKFDETEENSSGEQSTRPRRDRQETSQRLSRRSTDTSNAGRGREPSSSELDASASRSQKSIDEDAQSFSDASEDASDDVVSNAQEVDINEEYAVSRGRSDHCPSSRHTEQPHTQPRNSSARLSSRLESLRGALEPKVRDSDREKVRTSRQRRNQFEEVPDEELSSDEELSDGPDTPYKQHDHRHHASSRQRPRTSDKKHVMRARNDEKRRSTRASSARHAVSHDKRRSYVPECSDDSDTINRSDVESRDEPSSDETHRSRASHDSTRSRHRPSRYSTHEPSRRSHHPTREMDYPPQRSKPDIRIKRDIKLNNEARSRKAARKLPEGIVWPPGMEEECVARLGLDGHHPIAPPGLEHLVTEEQWGDYWTWLHWYSSWQMWYMKNGKKPKRKSDKDKRSRRRADVDESADLEPKHYKKHGPGNANWWVDVGPSKHEHRRDRYR